MSYQDIHDLQTIENNGNVPDRRISSADSARSILETLLLEDAEASRNRARIQGMIDGNAPYDDLKLRELGQADRINVNWGYAEAKVEEATIPYYDMLTSVEHYATVTTRYGEDANNRERWSRIITENFHKLLKSNPGFLLQHQLKHKSLVVHGKAAMYFRDGLDWRSYSIAAWNIIVPRNFSVDFNTWEFCFLLDEYYSADLYACIRNEEAAQRNGWNIENCKKAIIKASKDSGKNKRSRSWEWYQRELKNNSLHFSTVQCKTIKVAHLFVKEFSGRVSHYIFDRENPIDWLYEKPEQYAEMRNAFTLFTDGVGNPQGDYHSVRGLGYKVFRTGDALNKVNNAIMEGVIISSSAILQPETTQEIAKLQSLKIGPFTILPPGMNFKPINMSSNLGAAMQVASYFQAYNTGQIGSYTPVLNVDRSRRQTNKELETAEQDRAILTNNRAEMYMRALDLYYQEVYRRASNLNLVEEDPGGKEALAFQRACIDAGVPEAALKEVDVMATRSIGRGSAQARQGTMQAISQFIPMLPENKRIAVIRDYIAAYGGQQFVDKYAPELSNEPTGVDASIAALENNAFMQGGQVVLDRNQNHYIHLVVHLQFFGQAIQAIQEGTIDPRQVLGALNVGGPHMIQHLEFLQQDPTRKEQFTEINRQISELMKIADQVAAMVEQQESEQEQMAQVQQQIEPKLLLAQETARINQMKAESDIAIKQQKAMQQMQIKDMTAAQNIQLKAAKTLSDLQNKANPNPNPNPSNE